MDTGQTQLNVGEDGIAVINDRIYFKSNFLRSTQDYTLKMLRKKNKVKHVKN